MAPRFVDAYKSLLDDYSEQFSWVSRIISATTLVMPNRFSEAGVYAEACHSIVGLVGLFHDNLMNHAGNEPWLSWTTALEAIKQIEVLFEMRVKRMTSEGKCNQYTPLAALEFIKLFVRLRVLYTSQKIVTTVRKKEEWAMSRRRKPEEVIEAFRRLSETSAPTTNETLCSASENFHPSESRLSVSDITSQSENGISYEDGPAVELSQNRVSQSEYWWSALKDPAARNDEEEVEQISTVRDHETGDAQHKAGCTMILIGELLYIIRPIITIFALRRYGSTAWVPWLTSIGMDIASHALISKGRKIMKFAGIDRQSESSIQDELVNYLSMLRNMDWTPVDGKEMQRRKKRFLMYLLRSPVFEHLTKPGLEKAHGVLSYVSVVGTLTGKALEFLYGMQQYHVCTSGTW